MDIREQDITKKRVKLLKLIFEKSFKHDTEKGFRLTSGKTSDIYIDAKQVTTTAIGSYLTGEVIYDIIKQLDAVGIGGLTLGADPVAYSAMLASFSHKKVLDTFIIRKVPKGHGTKKAVEGTIKSGDKVIIVDDVVTTGGSTIEAIKQARQAGFNIVMVIALLDREEGGKENILQHVDNYTSVFTRSDLMQLVNQAVSTQPG